MASKKVRRNRSLLLIAVLGVATWGFVSCSTASPQTGEGGPFAPALAAPPHVEGLTLDQLAHTAIAELPDPTWVKQTAQQTGIPERALTAYAGVAIGLSVVDPECHLSWNTLAGIGWVESHHGTIFGGKILPNGNMSEPIFGIPLDGTNDTKALPDFDDGNFDGTAEFDRAVGPMQIVPPTWAAWHSDGNNDGNEDGQNIDDTVLAAGRYLCFYGGDLATPQGWQDAVFGYNQVPKYMVDVANKANEYASKVPATN